MRRMAGDGKGGWRWRNGGEMVRKEEE